MGRTISISEAARILGVGLAAARAAAADGEIPSIKCGRERRVPMDALEDLLRGSVEAETLALKLVRDLRIAEIRSRLAENDILRAELTRQLDELLGEQMRPDVAA